MSFRNVAKALSFLHVVKRSHVAIWNWIQKYEPEIIKRKRKRIDEFIIDETQIKVGSEHLWLWIAIEPKTRVILRTKISKERNMFVAERLLLNISKEYGYHPVSTDGGTWYPQACKFLKMDYHIHSHYEKSLIERTIHYIRDRIKGFDDYFQSPRKRIECVNYFTLKIGLIYL
jgi:putative transposase